MLAAVLVALLLVYTLAGFLLVPTLARRALNGYVAQLPGVQLVVEDIAFNPFTLDAQVRGLTLTGPGAAALAGFQSLEVAISADSLWERGYTLRRIALVEPALNVGIARDGRLNLLLLRAPPAPAGAAGGGATGAQSGTTGGTPLRIGLLSIDRGNVHFEDHSRATPFVTTLMPITFSLSNFQTAGAGAGDGHFELHAQAQSGESLELTGMLGMQPLSSSGEFSLQSLQAATLSAYLGDALPVALRSGQAGLSGSYHFTAGGSDTLTVQLSQLQVNSLAVADRGDASAPAWLTIPQLALTDVSIALPQRQVSIGSLALRQMHAAVAIEPDGTLSLQHTLSGAPAAAATTVTRATATSTSTTSSAGVWSVSLARLSLDAARLSLADRSVTPAVALELAPLQLTVQGYSSSGAQPVSFDLSTGLGEGGHVASHGALRLSPLSGSLSLDLQHFDLTVLQPYISQFAAVSLYRGNLGVQGTLTLGAGHASPQLVASGQVDLRDFATRDQLTNADFVNGNRVQLMDVRYQRGPDKLSIGTVRAQGLYGRVVIGSNGTLNLTSLRRAPAAAGSARKAAAGAAVAAAAVPAPGASAGAPSMTVNIARVQISGSTANFTDRSVQPNFSAAIEQLRGTISGLSSDPTSRARVQLTGAVDRYAPVKIDGQINVLSAQTFTDIALSFENIDLPLFNPYSGKFAGYSIAQGKLTTQMHYHVENQRLNATHHVVIDQLEFGAATDTKPAVPLPVRLAAALLKDRHGVITLDLPVSGSLNDPTFRVGPIVWKVFSGLLRHIVTAPFSWLGSILGGADGSRLAYVDFAPGSAALDNASTQKLSQLAQALMQRPQLHLDIPLHAVSDADDAALAQQGLDQAVGSLISVGAPDAAKAAAAVSGGPPRRFMALATLYRREFQAAPLFPTDALTLEQRQTWLEQQLRPRYLPHRQQRDALGLARATATQMAVLAGGKVQAARVFLTQRVSGVASTGDVRMDLQLQ